MLTLRQRAAELTGALMVVMTASMAMALIAPSPAAAQDVAITNARVIVGNGQVIESGTIIVRGGKIASVTAGAAPTQGLRIIDARGLSAMPGFVDGHKHVNPAEPLDDFLYRRLKLPEIGDVGPEVRS